MKRLALSLLLVVPGILNAQARRPEVVVQQKFVSDGTIRFHLEAGGYTISPTEVGNIVVTYHANSEQQLKRVKVEIKAAASSADVYISDTPHSNFNATIEVPCHSQLKGSAFAGEFGC